MASQSYQLTFVATVFVIFICIVLVIIAVNLLVAILRFSFSLLSRLLPISSRSEKRSIACMTDVSYLTQNSMVGNVKENTCSDAASKKKTNWWQTVAYGFMLLIFFIIMAAYLIFWNQCSCFGWQVTSKSSTTCVCFHSPKCGFQNASMVNLRIVPYNFEPDNCKEGCAKWRNWYDRENSSSYVWN